MRVKNVGCGTARLIVVTGVALVASPALGQEASTAAELLDLLRAGGVSLDQLVANEDGSVSVAAAQTEEPAGDDSEAVGVEGAPGAPAPSAAAEDAGSEAPASVDPPAPAAEWDNRLTIGYGASFGNTENQNLAIALLINRVSARSDLKIDAAYYYEESDGEETANRLTAGVQHDWLRPGSRWFYFADSRFDYDEFQDWNYRVAGHGGVGYHLVQRETLTIDLRAGAGAFREFGGPDDSINAEAVLGGDIDWSITERQSFVAGTRIYPDVSNGGEFRTRSTADYSIDIDRADGIALTFGLLHEYQSDVEPGTDEHDLKLTAGLSFDF